MKPISIRQVLPLWIAMFTFAAAPRMAAQINATAWTNVEGTTIWARLDGLDGDKAILHMRGVTYRVPLSKLAPKSIEKLGRMLELPPEKTLQIAGSRMPAATSSARLAATSAKPRYAKPARQVPDLLPLDDLVIDEPNENDETISDRIGGLEPIDGPDGLDLKGTLPVLGSALDPDHAGFGAVLPPRNPPSPRGLPEPGPVVRLQGKSAIAPAGVPEVIRTAMEAGNRLQTKYYKWGGGRARLEDSGYDCSGSVSYVLIKAGLLRSVLHSSAFTRYGAPGPGRWITIYARNGHVFMTICGLRLDTGGSGGRGESGPRWRTHMRGTSGFVMRHPPGF